jgi:hypothetical protein
VNEEVCAFKVIWLFTAARDRAAVRQTIDLQPIGREEI